MDEWSHASASQIKTFSSCRRKWHIEKFSEVERPEPSRALILGSAVHQYIENELLGNDHEEPVDEKVRSIAEAGREYWPTGEMFVEMKIELEEPAPGFVGFIDVYLPKRREIIDHKTVGNWKYALTEERLRFDPQMIIYAKSVDLDEVRLTHLQYSTKGRPECRRISVVVDRDHLEREFAKIAKVVEEMRPLATSSITSIDVEANRDHCSAYGGCPYLKICKNSRPFEAFNSPNKERKKMSKLADLLAKRKNQIEVVPKELEELRETPVEEAPPLLANIEEKVVPKSKSKSVEYDYSVAAIALSEEMPLSEDGIKSFLKGHFGLKRISKTHIERTLALLMESPSPEIVSDDGEKYIESKSGSSATPVEESEEKEETLSLFVDCLPVGESVSTLSEFLFPFVASVQSENAGLDPLLMDYGKGTRQVASKLDKVSNSISGSIYIDSRNPYWSSVSVVLESVASLIVRGVR